MTHSLQPAAQRLVVFVGGFDPRGARYYHKFCTQEASRQALVDGRVYNVSARQVFRIKAQPGNPYRHACWYISDPQAEVSEYVFFDWSAQVRAHWPASIWRVFSAAALTYWKVWQQRSTLGELRSELPNTWLSFIYPVLMLLLALFLTLLCGWGTAVLVGRWLDVGATIEGVAATAACVTMLMCCSRIDRHLHVSWLLRIFNFARDCAEHSEKLADEQVQAMAQWIFDRQRTRPDMEVVVLGFSVGSVKALALLNAWQQVRSTFIFREMEGRPHFSSLRKEEEEMPGLTLLTLGNCIPLFTLMPNAVRVRDWLHSVGEDPCVYWADVSSPGDSVSFAMCDLQRIAMPGSLHNKHYVNPRQMYSPRFHTLFTFARYRLLRRSKMRMHFQYLRASQLRGNYNFYSMLTSSETVRAFVEKKLSR